MSQELKIDFLTVSRYGEPPVEASTVRALAAAGLGAAEYVPRNEPASGGRERSRPALASRFPLASRRKRLLPTDE